MVSTAAPGVSSTASTPRSWTAESIRSEFPILDQVVNCKPLVYLDSAATAQKPRAVLDAVTRYYERDNANIHRGVHTLAERATQLYESVREQTRAFIGASVRTEIIFTRGTTESLNLVALGWGRRNLGPTDAIVLTPMEHHANLVPWQVVAKERRAQLRFAKLTSEGDICLEHYRSLFADGKVRVAAYTAASNVLGTLTDVKALAAIAREHGAISVVDAAQLVPHERVCVRDLGCDFLAFSGHKIGAPTGVGVLYGRKEVLEQTDPLMTGGEMIRKVELTTASWNDIPWRFEAGTMNIAQVVGLGAAMAYLDGLGFDAIRAHADAITTYALEQLGSLDVTLYGPPIGTPRAALVAFNAADVHPHDLAQLVDQDGVAIRAGHHCAQPLMAHLGVGATSRASFFVHTTRSEIDALVRAVGLAQSYFA